MNEIINCGKVLASVLGIGVLSACLFSQPEQSDIVYYDLMQPKKIASVPLDVAQLVSFSGERQRMARRDHGTRINGSDFHKWVQTPGSLLTRYLQLAFRNEASDDPAKLADPVELRGEVLSFEIDGDDAVLGVRYHLRRGRHSFSKTVLIREKMERPDPECFPPAMSRAADRLAQFIAADAAKLPPAERK